MDEDEQFCSAVQAWIARSYHAYYETMISALQHKWSLSRELQHVERLEWLSGIGSRRIDQVHRDILNVTLR